MNKRMLVVGFLSLLAATSAWAAPPEGLTPRRPADKLRHPRVPADTAVDHIVIKFHEGTRMRLRGNALVALPRSPRERARLTALGLTPDQVEADLHEAHSLLTPNREVRGLRRLFSTPEEGLAARRARGEERSGRELADLDLYYLVEVRSDLVAADVADLIADLNALASVEIAYVEPPPQIAGDISPSTPDFEAQQGYLDHASAGGVDARYAWTIPGGRGQGVKIIDIEVGWRTTHEDLPALFHQGGAPYTGNESLEHGTAVLGELVAPDNGYGVTGVANQALAGTERVNSSHGYSTAGRITAATAVLSTGDIIVIELHQQGSFTPDSPCPCLPFTTCDFIPMEISPGTWDAIHDATANGIIVVEAGGNGATSLDDPIYNGWFSPSHDSGAILVAASNSGPDRSPTCFSNYGSRFDLHAWGWDVVTLGYGNHPSFNGANDPNQYYTHDFDGTSSATPIVAGAAADLQGVARAHGIGPLTPAAIRQRLKSTGTPQVPGPKHIGPQPNLRAAIDGLLTPPPVAGFSFVCTGLSCSFNGTGSTGTGLTYAWSFGGSIPNANHSFPATGVYTVTLTITDFLGRQSSRSKKVSVTDEIPGAAEGFFTVPPCRIADTRTTTPLSSGVQRLFQVTGLCGIPATAKAVSFNITVVSPTGPGHLVVFPGNQTSGPFAHATINFDPANSPRANNTNLRLATNGSGSVNLHPFVAASPGQVHVILDVYGYFSEDATPAPGAQGPLGFQTLTPCRIADTRTGTPIAAGTTRNFTVQGVCGVPAGAAAAPLNLTIISPTAGGHAPLFQAGVPPGMPVINFNAGVVLTNAARIRLAPTTPDVSVNYYSPTAGASTHATIDVFGYFSPGAPLKYRPITACRAVDTRFADQGGPAALGAPETRNFQIRGNCGVPTSAKAVAVNITSVGSAGPGYLIAYPSGGALPAASYLSFDPGQGALANGGIVALSTLPNDLAVTSANSTHVIIDVFGYFQ